MRWRWMALAGLFSTLVLLGSQRVTSDTNGLKVGIVDIPRLGREASFADLRRDYEERRRAYAELVNLRQNYLMLTGLEWADLRRLLSKPQRSRQEEERLQQLRRIELEREAELQRLQQIPPSQLSAAERARLEELTRLWKEGRDDANRLQEMMEDELRRVEAELSKAVDERVRQAINAVATKQSLDLVLDRSAIYFVRGQLVDITDAVLAELNAAPSEKEGDKGEKTGGRTSQ
jgi:Skp family chaperone for outer membrane proteins